MKFYCSFKINILKSLFGHKEKQADSGVWEISEKKKNGGMDKT